MTYIKYNFFCLFFRCTHLLRFAIANIQMHTVQALSFGFAGYNLHFWQMLVFIQLKSEDPQLRD